MTRSQSIKNIIQKRKGFFSLDQIVAETHFPRRAVGKILEALEREGAVVKSSRPSWVYRVKRVEEGEGLVSNRMWSVIRNKSKADGFFTLRDLIILANAKRETARSFLKSLRRAGFIAPNKPAGMGVYWRLLKDPGPGRPYATNKIRKK